MIDIWRLWFVELDRGLLVFGRSQRTEMRLARVPMTILSLFFCLYTSLE
jgi:hypothetical protein